MFLKDQHRSTQNPSRISGSNENQRLAQENTMLEGQLGKHHRQENTVNDFQLPRTPERSNPTSLATSNHGSTSVKSNRDDVPYEAEAHQYRQQHAQLFDRYRTLVAQLNEQQIDSFEDLARQDKRLMQLLMELVKLTEPMPLEGYNIGLFGITSTGKSTLLNAILCKPVAETGAGETTTKIKPYPTNDYVLWDVPGRNDEVSYFSMEYISFFKGLSKRLILIQATVKENSSLMRLLDAAGLSYTIVVNKFDRIHEKDRAAFQDQTRREITELGLKGVEKLYFVSATHPEMFSDWLTMINDAIKPSFSLR